MVATARLFFLTGMGRLKDIERFCVHPSHGPKFCVRWQNVSQDLAGDIASEQPVDSK